MTLVFFFNDTATTEIYTLSLHDALPILCSDRSVTISSAERCWRRRSSSIQRRVSTGVVSEKATSKPSVNRTRRSPGCSCTVTSRSEEHTSELQSRQYLVCRLLLEKKTTR